MALRKSRAPGPTIVTEESLRKQMHVAFCCERRCTKCSCHEASNTAQLLLPRLLDDILFATGLTFGTLQRKSPSVTGYIIPIPSQLLQRLRPRQGSQGISLCFAPDREGRKHFIHRPSEVTSAVPLGHFIHLSHASGQPCSRPGPYLNLFNQSPMDGFTSPWNHQSP